jgi:hypothetical protein
MGGYVLSTDEACYADLKQPGRIVIEADRMGKVRIKVSGFEFSNAASCREHATKAMAWARDVLDTAHRADVLVPGGHISSSIGD